MLQYFAQHETHYYPRPNSHIAPHDFRLGDLSSVSLMANSNEPIERVRKQLRSVLISEKHGIPVDRIEEDYLELVQPCLHRIL